MRGQFLWRCVGGAWGGVHQIMYDDWLIFFTLNLFCRVGGKESCLWHNARHACVDDKCECFLGTVYLNVSAQTGSFLAYVTKSRNLSYNRTRKTSFEVSYMHMLILVKLHLRHDRQQYVVILWKWCDLIIRLVVHVYFAKTLALELWQTNLYSL